MALGSDAAMPTIINEKNTPIDNTIPVFWNVARIPDAAPRWLAGTLFMIDREDLQQLFRKRPDAALDMLAAMGRMTRKANSLLQARVSRNVNEQVEEERDNIVLRVADWVANFSGSITFLVVHVCFFAAWISFNATSLRFDPFPYNLLTMTVSLEAIILSTLLLFSSNRQGARDRVRADIE